MTLTTDLLIVSDKSSLISARQWELLNLFEVISEIGARTPQISLKTRFLRKRRMAAWSNSHWRLLSQTPTGKVQPWKS